MKEIKVLIFTQVRPNIYQTFSLPQQTLKYNTVKHISKCYYF